MRASKIFRIIFRIALYVMTISLTLTGLFGGLSALAIFGDFSENIKFDFDNARFQIFDPYIPSMINASVNLPFNITNAGYFPLDDLEMRTWLNMTYNSNTESKIIMIETFIAGVSIEPTTEYEGTFVATNDSFSLPEGFFIPDAFFMSLNISASYTYRLIHFSVEIRDLQIPIGGP